MTKKWNAKKNGKSSNFKKKGGTTKSNKKKGGKKWSKKNAKYKYSSRFGTSYAAMARLSTKRQYLNPFTRSGGRSSTSLRSVRTSFAATLPAITAIGDYCSIFSNINEGDNLSTIPRVLAPSNVIALGYGTTLVTLNRIRIAGYFVLREIASNNAVDDQMELNSILIRWL